VPAEPPGLRPGTSSEPREIRAAPSCRRQHHEHSRDASGRRRDPVATSASPRAGCWRSVADQDVTGGRRPSMPRRRSTRGAATRELFTSHVGVTMSARRVWTRVEQAHHGIDRIDLLAERGGQRSTARILNHQKFKGRPRATLDASTVKGRLPRERNVEGLRGPSVGVLVGTVVAGGGVDAGVPASFCTTELISSCPPRGSAVM